MLDSEVNEGGHRTPCPSPPGLSAQWLLTAFVVAWTFVLAGSAMLTRHPIVMGDETHYLLPALYGYSPDNFVRWQIVEQIPNHLFYRIYGWFPAAHAFTAAKVLNSLFLGAAAVPAFLVARQFLAPPPAAVFAAIVICAPISAFTRHFMPESAFYFGFWWLVYLIVRRPRPVWWQSSAAIGMCAGVLALIKPHALALAAGICLYLLVRSRPVLERFASVVILGGTFYATRLVAGRLLSATWEPLIAGQTYTRVLTTTGFESTALLTNVGGHVAAILVLAGFPLGAICVAAARRPIVRELRDLILLSACILAVLLAVTIYFSFSVYLINPEAHPITRLHGRYYAYTLPLVMLAYAALLSQEAQPRWVCSKRALAAYFGLAVICALVLARYDINILVDYVDLGLVSRSLHGYAILAFSFATIAACAWWFRSPRMRPGSWRLLVPIAWWVGISSSTAILFVAMPVTGHRLAPGYIDRALMASPTARELVGRSDGMIVAVAPMAAEAYRVMFHLRSLARARLVVGDTLRPSEVPADARWLMLLPGVRYHGPGVRQDVGGLTFVKLPETGLN